MKKLISITTFAMLVFAACTSKNAYIVTKSIDFENHMVDTTMLDFLRTRTKYPYIQDGWLFYSHAFPVPIDTPPHCHPDTSADTPLHSFLTDLDNIRITDLEYAGISTAALSVDPMIYRLDSASLVKYSKITNDAIAAAVKRHPDKYVGSICLPLPYLEESLAELDRAVNELGLDYFNTWSNYGDRHIYEEEFAGMKAAYCMGFGLSPEDVECKHIVPATGEFDLGVTISYNSVADKAGIWELVRNEAVACINPVNWKTDSTTASFEYNGMQLTAHIDPAYNLIFVDGFDFSTAGAAESFDKYPRLATNLHFADLHMYAPYIRRNALDRAYGLGAK